MADELKSAIAESLPADEVSVPSTEGQPQPKKEEVLAEATAKKAEQEQVPFNQHPDWIAFQRRKEEEAKRERERADRLEKQLFDITNKITTPQAPDPEANLTPEERAFWKRQREIAHEEAEKVANEKEVVFNKRLTEAQMTSATLLYRDFQRQHPDVKPGSLEEIQIAGYFKRGYDLEDAYKLTMGDVVHKKELEEVRKSGQAKTQEKIKANLETTSVSGQGLPTKTKKSFEDTLDEGLKAIGY